MKVVKFGGSSLASAVQLIKTLQIIKDDPKRKFVVVSAPGKRDESDVKVTDLLIEYGNAFIEKQPLEEIQNKIIQRFTEITDELEIQDVQKTISENILALADLEEEDPARIMDAFKASGENNNAILYASFLKKNGLNASYVNPKDAGIIVTNEPGNAMILPEAYDEIVKLRDREGISVIPGFFGYTKDGKICTFSRGGSDITGSIIAAGVMADLYENFTDVDAIFSAHPGIVRQPREVKELTFREMRELSYSGFGVFHDEALFPVFRADIPVIIKNTNNPEAPGTKISTTRKVNGLPVVGIAGDRGFCSLYLSKYLMNREVGFGRRVLNILEDFNINFEHMPSGIDDISVIFRENQLAPEDEDKLLTRLKEELALDEITIKHDLAMLAIVGEGMKSAIGVAARATQSFADADINLEMISQGNSEVTMLFCIEERYLNRGIRAIYDAYFK
ncbi:aspartate kinase [Vagococcus elongatus]|uniref:Aspartokinase n=1 Tax=Vagococcus elongatus TaxID=180344 RepID=A0A430B4E4_9ENTE|nr:aspartate kinase [Vagococcus elongatus]RSU15169.1 aspartate kinase [Vagococcus elongatus]